MTIRSRKQSSSCRHPGRSVPAAMTMVELLVVIAIIAVIAVVSIGALMTVPERARTRGTEALIAKIDGKLAQRLDQFNAKKENIRTLASCDLVLANNERNLARVIAVARTMRQEFPEWFEFQSPRATDTFDNDGDGPADELVDTNGDGTVDASDEVIAGDWNLVDLGGTAAPEQGANELPSGAQSHLRYVQRVFADSSLRAPMTTFQDAHGLRRDTSRARAECLYMIVTAQGTDTAEFAPNEIADTDSDGIPEFIDKWGNPIQFFLWPTHYVSPRQKPGSETNPEDPNQLLTERSATSWWTAQPGLRQRFETLFFSLTDASGSTPQPYRTYPLIVSAGPDGGFGLITLGNDGVGGNADDAGTDGIMGTLDDVGSADKRAIRITNTAIDGYGMDQDNIDNHSLRVR